MVLNFELAHLEWFFFNHCISSLLLLFVFAQDTLPATGFNTYFIRTVSDRSTAEGAKVTTVSPVKKIPRNIEQDILLENDVM